MALVLMKRLTVVLPAEERRAELMHHFNVYLSEKERLGLLGVKSAEDVYSFEDSEMRSSLFSVEGGAGLFPTSPELELLKMGGLAVYGMAWETNELASSAWDKNDTGLSELGKQMVRKCDSLGIISDVSHLSDKSFYIIRIRAAAATENRCTVFCDFCHFGCKVFG